MPRLDDKNKRKMYYYLIRKKRHTVIKNQIMFNNYGCIIQKKRKRNGKDPLALPPSSISINVYNAIKRSKNIFY